MKRRLKFRPNPKLGNRVRKAVEYQRCAYRTEQTCCQLRLRYFGGKTRSDLLGARAIEVFVSPPH
ncbi:MAG: hypothetical protein RBT20_04620, partial [Syntrophales bacterium]|nr:hypothetical protein [Syntrophales bacterium]